jgi:hypothetical protein
MRDELGGFSERRHVYFGLALPCRFADLNDDLPERLPFTHIGAGAMRRIWMPS